jgi:L-lactate dehydrogenase complex protein LldG
MNALRESRQAILDRLSSYSVDAPGLPDVESARLIRFDDPIEKFSEMLEAVGGQMHEVGSLSEVKQTLETRAEFAAATEIASLVPEAVAGNVDASSIEDPHDLASLDWVIACGEFMVAENGAIWVDGSKLPHRVMLFIPQYLAIIVPRDRIVHNMHEAYAKIGQPKPRFGVFVSGPSKTADIEQSLVLGAHGCRNLQVFLTPGTL